MFTEIVSKNPKEERLKVKIEMLRGNPHSESNPSVEKELGIPTRELPSRYKQYLINGRWWTAPRWTPESEKYLKPLPYTGQYDECGNRWVNYEGKKQL